MNKKYTIAWILWIFGFLAIEYAAIKDKRQGDTLSENIWAVIGTKHKGPKTALMWVARIGLGAFFVWVIPHLFAGV